MSVICLVPMCPRVFKSEKTMTRTEHDPYQFYAGARRFAKASMLLPWVAFMASATFFFCLGAVPGATRISSAASELLNYSAQGEARIRLNREDFETNTFTLSVRGRSWFLSYKPVFPQVVRSLSQGGIGEPLEEEEYIQSSDGTNVYFLHTHIPGIVVSNSVFASAWQGPGSVPIQGDRIMVALWYAYASSMYLDTLRTTGVVELLPLHAASLGRSDTPRHATGVVERSSFFPHLPSAMAMTNLSGKPAIHPYAMVFRAQRFIESGDLTLPEDVTVDYHVYLAETGRLFASLHIDIHLTNVSNTATSFDLQPELPGRSHIVCVTQSTNGGPATISLTTNKWPTSATIQMIHKRLVTQRGSGAGYFVEAALVLGFLIPVFILVLKHKRKHMP
jgi:hypothetical protein